MKDDLEWLGVSREHHQVSKATVQGFRRFVGAFLQLYHLTRLEHVINSIIRNYHELEIRTCLAWTD